MYLVWISVLVSIFWAQPSHHHPHHCHHDCTNAHRETVCDSHGNEYHTRCDYNNAHCRNFHLHEANCKTGIAHATHHHTVTHVSSVTVTTPTPAPTTPTRAPTTPTSTPVDENLRCLTLAYQTCPDDYQFVCGSNGLMYRNMCEFEKAKCMHKDLKSVQNSVCTL